MFLKMTGRLRKFNEADRAKVSERNNGLISVRNNLRLYFLMVHDSSVAGTYHTDASHTDDPIDQIGRAHV